MNNYVQFPRYAIFLIPDEQFKSQVEKFYRESKVSFEDSLINVYGVHLTIKAPFYLSHLYSEKDLIGEFEKLKLKNIFDLSLIHNISSISKFRNNFVANISFAEDLLFNFNDTMRFFDLYRKTLNSNEVLKDISRFGDLNEKQMNYYQIWGYPFMFDEGKPHISIIDINLGFEPKHNDFNQVKFERVSLVKQDGYLERFKTLI